MTLTIAKNYIHARKLLDSFKKHRTKEHESIIFLTEEYLKEAEELVPILTFIFHRDK